MSTGAAQMDGAILVLSATSGPLPQSRKHLLFAKKVVTSIIALLNKVDIVEDNELSELVEIKVRELLDTCEFNGNSAQIIQGSAKKL